MKQCKGLFMTGIYKITNKITGQCYIGQSSKIEQRWTKHRNTCTNPNYNEYKYPLYRAMRKYGIDNFSFEVLEECLIDELNEKEKYYITLYQSQITANGYNQDEGGNCVIHGKLSWDTVNEIKLKIKNTALTLIQIADEYGLHENTIQNINSGRTWKVDGETYPIRTTKIASHVAPIHIKHYYCSICGKEIKTNAYRCQDCFQKMQRKVERPECNELVKTIITIGFEATGRKYGVSGNAIKKWCTYYQIPHKLPALKAWYKETAEMSLN